MPLRADSPKQRLGLSRRKWPVGYVKKTDEAQWRRR